jgi:hypothetical protein
VSWNSGGIVAFYPTEIPYHRRAERLGDDDPVGYLVEGSRRMGLVVTLRVDHHATYPEAAAAHPEWIARDRSGQPLRHWATPELVLTCALGAYNERFMTDVMVELARRYRCDGFNHNRWAPQRMCHCDFCRSSFKAASGLDLPEREDGRDPRWAKYLLWREARIFALWDRWNAEIQKVNPNAIVLPGVGSERDKLNMSKVRARAQTLYLDYQGRRGLTPPWMAAKKGKELRAVLGPEKPVGITFSPGVEERYRWKDSVQADAELRVWVAEGVAHGLRPKVAKFAAAVHDRRWLKVVEDMYTWQWRAEPYLRNVGHPIASVGVLYSQQTARFYGAFPGDEAAPSAEDAAMGLHQALVEARVPFDVVHEDLMDVSDLDRVRVLVLPNIAALSDAQCDRIRRFVRRGGGLVATFESTLYDEWGRRRPGFGLGDLFGVRATGPAQGPMKHSYLRVNRAARGHALLAGLEEAERLINGVHRVPVTPTARFGPAPLFLVAPHPDLPMEEVYPRDKDRDVPELHARDEAGGRGRVVYFPFDVDRTFWEVLNPDHGRLLANAVRWAARGPQPVEVTGRGVLDIAAWRQARSLTVHLVNLTNPMMMKGPFREIFPVGEQRVRLRLPPGARPSRARLLEADREAPFVVRDGVLETTVPKVDVHEVVAIDL